MTTSSSMRLLDERHVATKVELMVWSSKMDLLALSNSRGEVALHRLSWQRVWSLPPPEEGATVRAMAWRPDGKVIAVAYSTFEVLLVDVENKETLHTARMREDVTCLSWVQEQEKTIDTSMGNIYMDRTQHQTPVQSQESASNFLPKLPSLSRSFGVNKLNNEENLEDTKKIRDQTQLNILLIGMVSGKLIISAFGLFPCGSVDLQSFFDSENTASCGAVVDASISDDLKVMFLVVSVNKQDEEGSCVGREMRLVLIDTPMLESRSRELHILALKHGHISSLQDYLSNTMQAISEAWESILLEMDSKLASYAATVPDGSVAADFLELLMLGVPSPELELFLRRDLTEKGLKKLSHSIELSYSNIQKLILKHIHCVTTGLVYHLTELRGMARHVDRYAPLGLNEITVERSLAATGAFLVKATEVQQVIETSMKKFKAFFRWLFLAILRLSDERAPPEITKITQQDLSFIADFLYNFDLAPEGKSNITDTKTEPKSNDENGSTSSQTKSSSGSIDKKPHFNLERVGQYLHDQNLSILPETEKNPWYVLLADNPILNSDTKVIPHLKKMSLAQQHRYLAVAIYAVFREPAECLGKQFSLQRIIRLPDTSVSLPSFYGGTSNTEASPLFKVTLAHSSVEKKLVIAYPNNETSLHFLEVPSHTPSTETKIFISQTCLCFNSPLSDNVDKGESGTSPRINTTIDTMQLKVLHMQFYLADVLSILLEKRGEDRSAIFIQFPRRVARFISVSVPGQADSYRVVPAAEGSCLLEPGSLRSVDNFVACRLAVSGSRKVAVVLSENRCKVRLFEMETEEEEEEDETMDATASTARDSDHSHVLDQSKSSELDD